MHLYMYPLLLFYIYKHTKRQEQCIKMIAWSGSVQRLSLVYRGWYITVLLLLLFYLFLGYTKYNIVYINSMYYRWYLQLSILIFNRDEMKICRRRSCELLWRRKHFLWARLNILYSGNPKRFHINDIIV